MGSAPHYALLPRTEIDDVRRTHYRDNFGIHIVTYEPSAGHPEVEQFVRMVADVFPPHLLFDPSIKAQNLDAARVAFSKLPTDDYLNKFAAAANEVSKSGFTRTAWTAFKREIKNAITATPQTRLTATTKLVQMMRADHAYGFMLSVLQDVLPLCEDPMVSQCARADYARTAFEIYLDAYCLKDATDLSQQAERYGLSPVESDRMAQTLDQLNFMNSGEEPKLQESAPLSIVLACESVARAGDIETAIAKLQSWAAEARLQGRVADALFAENTRARLLYLACRNDEAWQVYDDQIAPCKPSLSLEQWGDLQQNRTLIGFSLRKDLDTNALSTNSDTRSTRGADRAARSEDLLIAESASREQRHYESLPPLWRELRRTYVGLAWSPCERAHFRLAWEAYSAGWIRETVHHAITGNNVQCLKRLAENLIGWRNPVYTKTAVEYLQSNCQLPRYAKVAAGFVSDIADILSESDVAAVSALLKNTALLEPVNSEAEQCAMACWDAIGNIAFRLNEKQSVSLLHAAQASKSLKVRRYLRESILNAIRRISSVVTQFQWDDLAADVLPAAIDRWDYDYEQSLQTLDAVAQKSASAKKSICEALYKQGPNNVLLFSFAVAFAAKVDPDSLSRMATKVAELLGRQVSTDDQSDFPLSSSGVLRSNAPDGTFCIVQLMGGKLELRSLTIHQDAIHDEQLLVVVNAVLNVLAHPLNNRVNRLMLMDFLINIRRPLPVDYALSVFRIAHPLATGSAPPSPMDLPDSRTTDRFRFDLSSPSDEQAKALHLLIRICRHIGSPPDLDLPGLISFGLLHLKPELRQGACLAARDLDGFKPEIESALVIASLDPFWRVAGTALFTCIVLLQRGELRSQVSLLTTIAAKTCTAENPLIRTLTARLVYELRRFSPIAEQQAALQSLVDTLSIDVSYQVRTAAKGEGVANLGACQED